MYAIHQVVRRRSNDILGIEHLTLHQVHALMFVKSHQPVRISDLAHDLGISPASASVLVDRLVESGWIDRREGSEDRRVTFLHLTPSSTERLEAILAQRSRDLGVALDTLDEHDQKQLDDLLSRLLEALERED